MKVTVDRFEGDVAVLLVRPDETLQILVPRELLPDIDEGDVLEFTVRKDEGETREARERVSSLIEKLRNKGD